MAATPTKQCLTRLQRELKALRDKPEPTFTAAPDPNDILIWSFVFDGPVDTPYQGGRYVGELEFAPEYPFKPPTVKLLTPSGRFVPNAPICMSNSSFHPESWSPMWGVSTILTGFISFFVSNEGGVGSMTSPPTDKKAFAASSAAFNYRELNKRYARALPEEYQKDGAAGTAAATTTTETTTATTDTAKTAAEPAAKKPRLEAKQKKK